MRKKQKTPIGRLLKIYTLVAIALKIGTLVVFELRLDQTRYLKRPDEIGLPLAVFIDLVISVRFWAVWIALPWVAYAIWLRHQRRKGLSVAQDQEELSGTGDVRPESKKPDGEIVEKKKPRIVRYLILYTVIAIALQGLLLAILADPLPEKGPFLDWLISLLTAVRFWVVFIVFPWFAYWIYLWDRKNRHNSQKGVNTAQDKASMTKKAGDALQETEEWQCPHCDAANPGNKYRCESCGYSLI